MTARTKIKALDDLEIIRQNAMRILEELEHRADELHKFNRYANVAFSGLTTTAIDDNTRRQQRAMQIHFATRSLEYDLDEGTRRPEHVETIAADYGRLLAEIDPSERPQHEHDNDHSGTRGPPPSACARRVRCRCRCHALGVRQHAYPSALEPGDPRGSRSPRRSGPSPMMPLEYFEQWYALTLLAAGTAAGLIVHIIRNRKSKP